MFLQKRFSHDKPDKLQPAERAALKESVTPNELWIDVKL